MMLRLEKLLHIYKFDSLRGIGIFTHEMSNETVVGENFD